MNRRSVTMIAALGLVTGVAGAAAIAASGAFDTEASPAPLTLTLGAGGAGESRVAAASGSNSTLAGAPAADMAIWKPSYELKFDLAEPEGPHRAWKVTFPDSRALATKVAAAFGVTGEVREDEWSFSVGAPEGPVVNVQKGTPSWSYSGASSMKPMVAGCVTTTVPSDAASGGADVMPAPCEPAKPEGLISADEATSKAKAVLDAIGAGDLDVTATANDWSTDVMATAKVGGVRVEGATSYLSYGANGELGYASGMVVEASEGDEYPLVGVDRAFANLQEGKDPLMFGGVMPAMARDSVSSVSASGEATVASGEAVSEPPVAVATAGDVSSGSGSSAGGAPGAVGGSDVATPPDTVAVDPPMPIEPVDAPATPITGVELGLTLVPGASATEAWFVPVYVFTGPDQLRLAVLAVDPSYVNIVAPQTTPVPEPLPAPVPGDEGGVTTVVTSPAIEPATTEVAPTEVAPTPAQDPAPASPDVPVDRAATTEAANG